MKHLLIAPLLLAACDAFAGPHTLTANPYATAPAAAVFTANGGAPIACTLPAVTGGWQPTCSLASLTTPGTYTLVMTVTTNTNCINTLDAADCVGAGSASSKPFAYTWRDAVVPIPVLQVVPSLPAPQGAKP